jgi:hypothetical protein
VPRSRLVPHGPPSARHCRTTRRRRRAGSHVAAPHAHPRRHGVLTALAHGTRGAGTQLPTAWRRKLLPRCCSMRTLRWLHDALPCRHVGGGSHALAALSASYVTYAESYSTRGTTPKFIHTRCTHTVTSTVGCPVHPRVMLKHCVVYQHQFAL